MAIENINPIDPATIAAASTMELIRDWCYSDAHKDVFGYRPRGETSREEVVYFWENFHTYWRWMRREEEERLQMLRERHGINFKNLSEYHSWWERTEWERHCQEMERLEREEAEKAAREADYRRRRTIIDAISDWDFGVFKGAFA